MISAVSAAEFVTTIGGPYRDFGTSVVQGENFVVLGWSQNLTNGSYDIFASKFDDEGNLIWGKAYSGSKREQPEKVIFTDDNSYLLSGTTESYGFGGNEVFLVKIDVDGNLQWARSIGTTGDEYARTSTQLSDGNYLVGGFSSEYGPGWNSLLLSKFTSNGELLWSRTFGSEGGDRVRSLVKDNGGGFFAAGSYDGWSYSFLSKFNGSGFPEWTVSFDASLESLVKSLDGNIYVTGQTNNDDLFVMKFNNTGGLKWAKTFGGTENDIGYSITQLDGEGLIVTGKTYSFGADSQGVILKYDTEGDLIWSKVLGGSDSDYLESVSATSDGGFIITGRSSSYGSGDTSAIVAKLSADGTVVNCSSCNLTNITGNHATWDSVEYNEGISLVQGANTSDFNITSCEGITPFDFAFNEDKLCYYEFVLPIAESFISNSRTTNFSEVSNISAVENLTLATNHGVITFGNETVNAKAQDYDSNVVFGDCFVAVKSENLDLSFNATAYLLMNNSDGHCGDNTIFTSNDFAADAGAVKSSARICSDCELISATDNSSIRYRVPHFSSYAIGSNSNMTIDANDPKQVNQTVTFTAVYRNSTDGTFISGATCDIGLPNGTVIGMAEGTSEYTHIASFPSNGTYTYNVTCEATGYQTLKTDDTFTITNQIEQIPEFNTIAILALLIGTFMLILYKKGKPL